MYFPCQIIRISIRAPAKGATIKLYSIVARICNFNPRSREGSDLSVCTNLIILIHFNTRYREGSDSLKPVTTFESSNFNPRSREGSDLFASLLFFCCLNYFNPRSREGSDSNIIQQFSFFCIILYILSVIT